MSLTLDTNVEVDVNSPGWVSLSVGFDPPAPHQAGTWSVDFNFVRVDQVFDPVHPGSLMQPPDDLAGWIAAIPGVTALGPPSEVEVGGLDASALDATVGDHNVQFGPIPGVDDVQMGFDKNSRVHLVAVTVAGRHVLVTIQVANPDGTPVSDDHYTRAITTLQPVIDSIVWGSSSPLGLSAAIQSIGPSGKIVFNRTNDDRSVNTPFMIDPDGSNEVQVADDLTSGIWSPDDTRLLLGQLVADPAPVPGAESGWIRPAVINADGSGFTLLNAYPDRHMQLFPQAWTADGQRIYVYSGDEDVNAADVGVYTVRASDGGDLTRAAAPAFDFSPDGTHVLLNKFLPRADTMDLNTLYVVNSDGTGMVQLSPDDPNATVVSSDFWGGVAQDWSPDSSRVAFCLFSVDTNQLTLEIVNRDGSGLKQIVPGSIGASSVRFSPDGSQLAFTAEAGPDNQIWVARPDGSGQTQLTNNADGYVSMDPVWSPDGSKLLFQRKYFTPGTSFRSHDRADVTLWTMNADGSGQQQLSPTPLANDWIGSYAWWPAPSAR